MDHVNKTRYGKIDQVPKTSVWDLIFLAAIKGKTDFKKPRLSVIGIDPSLCPYRTAMYFNLGML